MGGDVVWLVNVTVYLVQVGIRVIRRSVVEAARLRRQSSTFLKGKVNWLHLLVECKQLWRRIFWSIDVRRHANEGFALCPAGPQRVAAMKGAVFVVDCCRPLWCIVQTR